MRNCNFLVEVKYFLWIWSCGPRRFRPCSAATLVPGCHGDSLPFFGEPTRSTGLQTKPRTNSNVVLKSPMIRTKTRFC